MAGFMDPILAQIARQGDIMMYGQQLQRQRHQDEQSQRQQGLQERQTLAQLAKLEQDQLENNKYRQTLADLFKPRQVGGPLAGADQYQPVGMQAQTPTDDQIYQALAAQGLSEQALKFKPSDPEYQIVEGNDGFTYLPKTPGKGQPVPTGVKKPTTYTSWGYGQMRGSDGSVVSVPTAPRPAAGGAGGAASGKPLPPEKQAEADVAKANQLATIDTAIESLSGLMNHPGRSAATGASSIFNIAAIPGSQRKTFLRRLETFQSQMFIPMVSQMKGMGALSDAEGKKLIAAVGALSPDMSEEEFSGEMNRIMRDLEAKKARIMQPSASLGEQPAPNRPSQSGGIKFLGFE